MLKGPKRSFVERELRSKVLKEALLLLLLFLFFLVAWNHEQKMFQKYHHLQKMFQMEQKMCKGTKHVPISQKEAHKRPKRADYYLPHES